MSKFLLAIFAFPLLLLGQGTILAPLMQQKPSGALGTITFGTSAGSGAEPSGANSTATTSAFSLTAGQLLVCLARNAAQTADSLTVSDLANNTNWQSETAVVNTNGSLGMSQIFYSFTTNGNASETVTVTDNTASQDYFTLSCATASKSGSSWYLDAYPTPNTSAGSTTPTTNSFSTVQTKEIIFAWANGYGGQTWTAGTIGGTSATGSWTNGSGNADQMGEYIITTTAQSGITGTFSTSGNHPWVAYAISFYNQ